MYNIVIPVIYRDYSILETTVRYIHRNLSPSKVIIVTDIRFQRYLPKEVLYDEKCIVVDENRILDGMTLIFLKDLFLKLGRTRIGVGWYFQQFLKMAFALSDFCDTEYYLSWDSDTIPLRKIDFFNKAGKPYFTMK